MSLETTYQILATTDHHAATEVLLCGLRSGDVTTQTRCIESLANRVDDRSHDALIASWSGYRVRIQATLADSFGSFGETVAQRLSNFSGGEPNHASPPSILVEMAVSLRINAALPSLIDLAWKHSDPTLREQCLQAVLELAQHWGHQARRKYPGMRSSATLERQRTDLTNQLFGVANDFLTHRCEELLDALIAISTWNDTVFRTVLDNDTPCRAVVLRRLRHSQHSSVMELLAGFIRRRSIPEAVLPIMLQREDAGYRELLLELISSTPSPTTIKNLKEYGLPDCLRGGVSMLRTVGIDRDAAIAHAYSAAMQSSPEAIAILLEIVDRQPEPLSMSSKLHDAIIVAMGRCHRPTMDFWQRALNSDVMDDPDQVQFENGQSIDDLAATICVRLIDLTEEEDYCLASHAMDLLESFSIQNALDIFPTLSVQQQLRMGRALLRVDSSTLDVVSDSLRHAVMQKRLEAIAFTQTLGLVDLMMEPLTKIAREDHQTARLAATEAFASASGDSSLSLLKELSTSQKGSIRDAALDALKRRLDPQDRITSHQPEIRS